MTKELARDIAYGALRIDWRDTEAAARRVAEYAADMIVAYRKEHEEVLAGALAAQREQCAKVAEAHVDNEDSYGPDFDAGWEAAAFAIAAAIRAQKEKS